MTMQYEFVFIGVSSDRSWAIVLGLLAAVVSLALLIVSWTRWGQTKSLTKCVVLAVLAHVWLLMYAYGTRVAVPGRGGGYGQGGNVVFDLIDTNLVDSKELEDSSNASSEEQTSETKSDQAEDHQERSKILAGPLEPPELLPVPETPPIPEAVSEPSAEPIAIIPKEAASITPPSPMTAMSEAPPPIPSDPVLPSETLSSIEPNRTLLEEKSQAIIPVQIPPPNERPQPMVSGSSNEQQHDLYQHRQLQQRGFAAAQYGGDASTEASVEGALHWLARNQHPNGHWDAAEHGAGRETRTLGEDRSRAGLKADTGMTALAILAFQGAGYTHLQGKYADTIRKGIEYLLDQQMPSGDLAGRKQVGGDRGIHYSRMYCHGMATFALAEALSMTRDQRLQDAVTRAAQYTLACQNPRTGGWRYVARENDDGDLSQFGWQAMALHSARSAGIVVPSDLDARFQRFLDLVSAGQHQGLATYRPRTTLRQTPTSAMTAEAMASRLLLRIPTSPLAIQESKKWMLENLPGSGEDNLYYWYYGTLAMFQMQDREWGIWNEAMKKQLVGTQVLHGNDAGSWNPTCIWSGYGGRVYSTALSCMCLEVYYRYLPIYRPQATALSPMGWSPIAR